MKLVVSVKGNYMGWSVLSLEYGNAGLCFQYILVFRASSAVPAGKAVNLDSFELDLATMRLNVC